MNKLIAPVIGAGLAALLAVGAASAASPTPPPVAPTATTAPVTRPAAAPAADVLPSILGLTSAQVMALRQQGLSLAQIAERQKVDPQKLVDALAAQWSSRIDVRLAAGAITPDQAKTLKANLATQAKAMVYQVTLGGMRGSAVGAGPAGTMRGMAAAGAGAGMGAGRGGMMRGAGAAAGCPIASAAPAD